MKLLCRDYTIRRTVAEPVYIAAEFILACSPHDTEKIKAALAAIEELFYSGIDFVKSDPERHRCAYCASLNDKTETHCTKCGAAL
jgi:hypothetical protein